MDILQTILVTGAAGYVGVNTCLELVKNPCWRVVGLVRRPTDSPAQNALQQAGVQLQVGDVTNVPVLHAVIQTIQPTVIVHLAADITPRPDDIAGLMAVNVQGFANVLQAAADAGGVAKVVYASTYAVYGVEGGLHLHEEQPLTKPITPYAASKQMAEILATSWSSVTGVPTVGLRLFHVLGPWARANSILSFFAERLHNEQPVPLFGQGALIRDFVSVIDVARAIARLITQPIAGSLCLNVGTGRGHTTAELLDVLAQAYHLTPQQTLLGPREHEPQTAVADTSRIQDVLGWHPQEDLRGTVEQFVGWCGQKTKEI
jgi:UDP-glucuronate 4-epimerase